MGTSVEAEIAYTVQILFDMKCSVQYIFMHVLYFCMNMLYWEVIPKKGPLYTYLTWIKNTRNSSKSQICRAYEAVILLGFWSREDCGLLLFFPLKINSFQIVRKTEVLL